MTDGPQTDFSVPEEEQAQQLRELKSKLETAGIDVSKLVSKPLSCDYSDSSESPPFYSVFHIPTKNSDAVTLWEKLKELTAQTGYSPVINQYRELYWQAPFDQRFPWDPETDHPPYEPKEIQRERFLSAVKQAEEFDADQWFKERLAQEQKQMEEPMSKGLMDWLEKAAEQQPAFFTMSRLPSTVEGFQKWAAEEKRQRWDLDVETWPENVEPSNYLYTVSKSPHVYIDLFQTDKAWEILEMRQNCPGNNYYMTPIEHMAVLKKWHKEYGADLIVHAGDTLEFRVSRPPQTREAAIKLAVEHYLYCVDCVVQSVSPATIKQRAARILNGSTWYFWWD